jgi:hypothetical protein
MSELRSVPKPGTRWQHNKSGDKYKVALIANAYADSDRKDEYPTLVIYRDRMGRDWSRHLDNFMASFTAI